jgi:hypothetical protein
MIAFIIFFIGAFGIGTFVLSKLRLHEESAPENTVVAIGVGLGLWCFALFLLGHLGLFYKWILLGTGLLAALPGAVYIFKGYGSLRLSRPRFSFSIFEIVILAVVAGICILTFISCFSPVAGGITNDEIATHLSVPKDWLSHHKICILPYSVSHLAGHIELLFLWFMAFAPEYGPKLFTWTCFVLCAILAYSFSKGKVPGRYAAFGAVFFIINPLVFRESCSAFIDLPAALFNFLAFWSLLRYSDTQNNKYLLLSAFFMGVGCGAKPSNFFYVPAMIVVFALLMINLKTKLLPGLKKLILFVLLIALFGSPWVLRNLALTGSPTFPPPIVLYGLNHNKPFYFSGKPFAKESAADIYAYYRSRIEHHGIGVHNFFLLPWNITMHPESFSIGDSVGAIMLSFLPLVLFFRKRPWWTNMVLAFGFTACACIYFFIIPEARYFIPAFLAAGPLAAWIAEMLARRKGLRTLVQTVIVCNALFALAIGFRVCFPKCKAALVPDYRRAYCQKTTPFYEAIAFLNREKPSRLFVFYGSQMWYYLKTPYRIEENALDTIKSMRGALLLDIDYSQTLSRYLDKRTNAYSIKKVPDFLNLIFNGPDARVYTVK